MKQVRYLVYKSARLEPMKTWVSAGYRLLEALKSGSHQKNALSAWKSQQ